ncbi:AAA family ATPase (plasmid) [Aestuarium zhoushanense]|nr:AAA family ATPase [Aestuarium zhoushanense]
MSEHLNDYLITDEPFYCASSDEVDRFTAAYNLRMPMMLKGPTGSGKTRFVEHMAWRLKTPLITVACHEDMTAADLVGRYLLSGDATVWDDGPLTRAVRYGGICYLDEIVEARQDTTVVIHPLTDGRRILPLEKKNELVHAHPDFHLVISYNPGYQSVTKDLKESTKQRFAALDFGYPTTATEVDIIVAESGIGEPVARQLVQIGEKTRNLKGHGLDEGASTRMLVQAAKLTQQNVSLEIACEMVLTIPLTDDPDLRNALTATIQAVLG